MGVYDSILRPALFNLEAETAHRMATTLLRVEWPWRARGGNFADERLHTNIGDLAIANPICLSAGFDKNAEALAGLQHLGFGAITVGSILPDIRRGNPRPRLVRFPKEMSLGNCYGLPSDGVVACTKRLAAVGADRLRIPVIANIDAPSIELYLRSFDLVEPLVNAVELGLQCPNNTEDHGEFHDPVLFEALLTSIMKRRHKPVFLKLALPDSEKAMQNRLDLAERAAHFGIDGINVPGIFKRPEPGVSLGVATISGKAAFGRTLSIVRELSKATGGRIAIKANGGIMTGDDALQVLMAGASSVDILSAFVYRGWATPHLINSELLEAMRREGIASLQSLKTKTRSKSSVAQFAPEPA